MNKIAKLEVLMSALDSYLRATPADPRNYVRAESRLFDAAVDAGMPVTHADLELWANERIAAFLLAA